MTTMSPADFMTSDQPDEEPAQIAQAPQTMPATGEPLELIASALERIVTIIERHGAEIEAETQADQRTADLEAELSELTDLADLRGDKIEAALAALKKSTSKLAHEVRGILEGAPESAEPAFQVEPDPEPAQKHAPGPQCFACERFFADVELLDRHACTAEPVQDGPPADDAPLEEWLAYGAAQGLELDPQRTNRAMIRTALGIPQPVAEKTEG